MIKTILGKLLSITLCLIFCFIFCSCEFCRINYGSTNTSNYLGTSINKDDDPFTFESVDELKIAIKKEPKYYNNKQVTVKGTAIAYEDCILLVDFNGTDFGAMERYESKKNSVVIIIPDDVLYSVLETGDYIEVNGTVAISDGKTYLDNCDYTMIATCKERE